MSLSILAAFFPLQSQALEAASLFLTPQEAEYVKKAPPVRVGYIDGVAPISYKGENGLPQGVAKEVLDLIAARTGLRFTALFINSTEDYKKLLEEDSIDIVAANAKQYAKGGYPVKELSAPYLTSKTVVYIRGDIDNIDDLSDRSYAAIEGSALPSGVNPDKAVYFTTRRAALEAVNSGKADYGFSNEFSIAYYTIKYGYDNILTVPHGKEGREYSIGYVSGDPMLISVMNKALASISNNDMQGIVLRAASYIKKDISIYAVLEKYSLEVTMICSALILILSLLAYAAFKNMVAYRKSSRAFYHLSRTDILTGLNNTGTQCSIARDKIENLPAGSSAALLLIDIDNFKSINDSFGHYMGDQTLKTLASTLRQLFAEKDGVIGRMGGDEFSVYLPHVESKEELSALCSLLYERIRLCGESGGQPPFTISAGCLRITEAMSFDTAYKEADIALYAAKNCNKNCFVDFEDI